MLSITTNSLTLGLLAAGLVIPLARSQTSIIDATTNFKPSSESIFDHMVKLEDNLWFHWNDINAGKFNGRLVHVADSIDQAPSWLGFGVWHDNQNYTSIPKASSSFMVGSTAMIGIVTSSEETIPAQHYHLTAQSVEGVTVASDDTSYTNTHILQHDQDDGKVVTNLSFIKALSGAAIGNLRRDGVNIFLWAQGPPLGKSTGTLGKHSKKGVIFLDLVAAQQEVGPTTPAYNARTSEGNSAPVVRGKCGSALLAGTDAGQVDLTQALQFHWKLLSGGKKVQIALAYTGGDAWLGVAISSNGKMVGSSAVIGSVDKIQPTHYNLNDQDKSGVVADESVVLEEASITSAPSSSDASQTTTILRFTKTVNDPNDAIPVQKGLTTFLYAVGSSQTLAYHEHRGAFQLNLEDCGGTIAVAGTWTHHGIFVAHGFFAIMAWALASPFAVSVALFRTLVPASWIYIHVFANVFTFFATLIVLILGIVGITKEDAGDHFSKAHHYVGLVLFFIATFQVINGFLRPPVQRKESNRFETPQAMFMGIIHVPRSPRETWQLLHRLSGLTALAMGIYQVQSGLGLYAAQFNTESMVMYYWVYVGAFVLVLAGLRIWVYIEEEKARKGVMQAVRTSEPNGLDDINEDNDDVDRETEMPTVAPVGVLKGTMS